MKEVEITENRFFGLIKKTYKYKIPEREYARLTLKYYKEIDPAKKIMEMIPAMFGVGVAASILRSLTKTYEDDKKH